MQPMLKQKTGQKVSVTSLITFGILVVASTVVIGSFLAGIVFTPRSARAPRLKPICGDSKCEKFETEQNCPKDCKATLEILFQDDFEDGDAQGWDIGDGWDVIQDEENYVLAGNEHSFAKPKDVEDELVSFKFNFKILSGGFHANFMEGSGASGEHIRYFFGINSHGTYLTKQIGDVITDIKVVEASIPENDWHSAKIKMKDTTLALFIDDAIIFTATDQEPMQSGGVSFEVLPESNIYFDNVVVIVPEAPPVEHLWTQTNGPEGGAYKVIAMDPFDNDVLLTGIFDLHKSINQGESWTYVDTFQKSEIEEIIFDPLNVGIIYIATRGNGIFKSIDGGNTWESANTGLDNLSISKLAIDESNPNVLIAGSHPQDSMGGEVYKTTNGGDSWIDITKDIDANEITAIGLLNSDEIYIGAGGSSGGESGKLYYTENGGDYWQNINIGQYEETFVFSILVNPDDNNEILIGFGDAYNRTGQGDLLFKTTDGGEDWHPITLHEGVDTHINLLAFSKKSNNIVYLASGGSLHKSVDSGESWTLLLSSPFSPMFMKLSFSDFKDIETDPYDDDILILPLASTGIAKSTDGGEGWDFINNGLREMAINNLAVDPNNPLIVYAASSARSGGTYKTENGGETWTKIDEGGVYHPFPDDLYIDPSDSRVIYSVADVAIMFKSIDGGSTWEAQFDPHMGQHHPPYSAKTDFRFSSIYAMQVSPTDSNVLYVAKNGFGVYKSENGGNNWTYQVFSPDYTYSLAIDPRDSDIVYSGYQRKVFENSAWAYKSTGFDSPVSQEVPKKTMSELDENTKSLIEQGLKTTQSESAQEVSWGEIFEVPDSMGIRSIEIDPSNPDEIYAASIGKRGEIYKSNDKGKNWQKLNEHFIMNTVWGQSQLIVDPNNFDIAYIGTWLAGTWKTIDAGETWELLEDAPISSTALSLNQEDTNIIYLADRSSPTVWKSIDAGETWQQIANFATEGALLVMRVFADGDNVYASTFYPALRDGKLYKSTDAGENWEDITGTLPKGILDINVNPTDSNKVYVTTNVNGAFKSIDGGNSWHKMDAFPYVGAYDIEIDQDDPRILYASARGGSLPAWFTAMAGFPDGIVFEDDAGVYKSFDEGENWNKILKSSVSCRAIRRHPDNPNLLFAPDLVDGLQVSADAGETWNKVSEGLDNCIPTSVAVNDNKLYIGTQGCGVYSGDLNVDTGAITWQTRRSNKPVPEVHNLQINVDPTNPDNIFVASYPGGLYASTDGGKTFRDRNAITPSVVVDDPRQQGYYTLAIDQTDPSKMWLGTWGKGIYKSYNGMILNVPKGLFGKHITSLEINPLDSNEVYVGSQEGVFMTDDDGKNWKEINNGLLTKDIITLAIGSDGQLYAGTRGYGVFKFNQGGQYWEQTPSLSGFGVFWSTWERPQYQFTDMLINPNNPQIIYLASFPTGMFKSLDGGNAWKETNLNFIDDGTDGIFSLTFHPHDKNIIYAGTYNGVSVSYDGALHWKRISNGIPPEQWPFSIAIDSNNPDIMYAATKNGMDKGFCERHEPPYESFCGTVIKTTDGGKNWFEITNGLQKSNEFYDIIIYPHNHNILFLSSQNDGIFMSRNAGQSWEAINDGLEDYGGAGVSNNVAKNLVIDSQGRYLYFATMGRGVWKADLAKLDL